MNCQVSFNLILTELKKYMTIGGFVAGHGFKLAPVVGKVLAELATGQRPSYDLRPFRMDRFVDNTTKARL